VTHNELVQGSHVPILLVVVRVPESLDDWIEQNEDELAIRRCGYWISLEGRQPSENVESVTIHIPRTQVLTPEALSTIIDRIAEGQRP